LGDGTSGRLRLYFDRSVGKAVPRALREVGVQVAYHGERYPSRPDLSDEEWIQAASGRDEVIVHKDKRIRYRPGERDAFLRAGARMFLLGGNLNRFSMLRILMLAWPELERLADLQPPPFIFRIHASGRLSALYPSPTR
jgi:hypothetical protein